MPLPEPGPEERRTEWIERCMGDETMREEFPDPAQRFAVCMEQWRSRGLRGRLWALEQAVRRWLGQG